MSAPKSSAAARANIMIPVNEVERARMDATRPAGLTPVPAPAVVVGPAPGAAPTYRDRAGARRAALSACRPSNRHNAGPGRCRHSPPNSARRISVLLSLRERHFIARSVMTTLSNPATVNPSLRGRIMVVSALEHVFDRKALVPPCPRAASLNAVVQRNRPRRAAPALQSRGQQLLTANNATSQTGDRLQKVLALAGIASRRECEELIREGRVEVDRKVVTELGTRVDPLQQEIRVDGEALLRPKLTYFAVNKPIGVVATARDPSGRTRVTDLCRRTRRACSASAGSTWHPKA